MQQFFFTTVAKNYLSQASILFQSIIANNSNRNFLCFITDGYDTDDEIPDSLRNNVFDCRKLGVEDFEERSFKYSVTEFATSLKPHIFNYVFEEMKPDCAVFLDPDTKLYSDTDWISNELGNKSILLSPHFLYSKPYRSDYNGRKPVSELKLFRRVGFFNTGFIAIKNDGCGREFTSFWLEILKDNCLREFCYDQSWVDLLSNFFSEGIAISTDDGANVAYWNLHERKLTRGVDLSYVVNGKRLKFMHFSKIDKKFAIGASGEMTNTPLQLLINPEYTEIYKEYINDLIESGFQQRKSAKYRYEYFDNGIKIEPLHRRIFADLINRGGVLPRPCSVLGYKAIKSIERFKSRQHLTSVILKRVLGLSKLLDRVNLKIRKNISTYRFR